MKKIALLIAAAAVTFTSCAPKYNASTQKPVAQMSCAEMQDEYTKIQSIRSEAESKKGFSKENAAMLVLGFGIGAVVNEMDNRDVIEKVDARTKVLMDGATAKGCTLK